MAKIVFRLRNVSDDEADDIRSLLQQHNHDYYETSAGRWGIGLPAIWLHDQSEFDSVRALIEDYQLQRQQRIRDEYNERVASGEIEKFWQRCWRNPLRTVVYLAVVAVILYFSIMPFFNLLSVD